jgi:putative hydrolase of the HAD superfamily
VTVVVFDLDDTLYLERDFVRSGFRAVDRWLAREHAVPGLFELAWRLFATGQRGRIFDQALPHLGLAAEPTLVRRLVEVYRGHEAEIALLPEAVELLATLGRRYGLALLTDGDQETQKRKVKALGLESVCQPIVYTDAFGRAHWKPSPKGFLSIQRRFGLPPARFVYVGDNPAKDFRAARALGWRTIRVRHPDGEHARASAASAEDDADCTITRLADLLGEPLLGDLDGDH